MHRSINLSSDPFSLAPFADAGALISFYTRFGCDGVELILCGEDFGGKLRPGMVRGLHLIFYPEWISLWQNDFAYLDREFGSRKAWQEFYQATCADDLLHIYRHELSVAKSLGAEYVVFHIGDNALREYFTLHPRRTDREIIDTSCEFLNVLFGADEYPFSLLMENLWLEGMNLTDPEMTHRMLEGVRHPKKGLMLDTGHLLITNPSLRTSSEACEYIHRILDTHESLIPFIAGVHLHGALTGDYLLTAQSQKPPVNGSYLDKFARTAGHLSRIDPHLPLIDPEVPALIRRMDPDFLVYELSRKSMSGWESALSGQRAVFLQSERETSVYEK